MAGTLPDPAAAEFLQSGAAPGLSPGSMQPIVHLPTAVTAFVGRALKGPVHTPVAIANFAEFQRAFGGLWQPATLGYALEQYFENGGREAIVVRVVNGARAPTVHLPAGTGELVLLGQQPGTREYLRAAVDYDGVDRDDKEHFNLVLQRLRAPGTEWIEDQQILRAVSISPASERAVDRLLARSALARVVGPLPSVRPEPTLGRRSGGALGYIESCANGADGTDLTDYDLIGDAAAGTGLFALRSASRFALLCIPPLGRQVDVGVATLLVAARLCRAQQALLVVDPPHSWDSAGAALQGAADWVFQSDNAVLYFPRLLVADRLRGRAELFAPCGAAAGQIARADELSPPWVAAAGEAPLLRGAFRLALRLDELQRVQLRHVGVNCLDSIRPGAEAVRSPRTLLPLNAARGEWCYLPARRLTLWLQACVLEGTRWLCFSGANPLHWQRAQVQVEAFLESLSASGAFAGRDSNERYFVICDARVNTPEWVALGRCELLFGFAPWRAGEFQSCLVTHERAGSSVRTVTINRLATSGAKVAEEIETAILRQLVAES